MRQRRHRLQVSTFPFLAVLLCAMGSLILLLLVLDRRARVVAHVRMLQAASSAKAEDERAAAAHRAEWERRREQLHQQLADEDADLRQQLETAQRRLRVTLESLQKQEQQQQRQHETLLAERARQVEWQSALGARKALLAQSVEQDKIPQAERARLSADLERAERTLHELKIFRQRQQQTHSVVPYRGKHGDNRRPFYLECTGHELVFHPAQATLNLINIRPQQVHAEIDRLQAQRAERAGQPSPDAYVLLLVRPDGINTYYRTQEVLKALQVEFGYEFIEADWALDFPEEGATPRQNWMAAAKTEISPNTGSAIKKVQGLPAPPPEPFVLLPSTNEDLPAGARGDVPPASPSGSSVGSPGARGTGAESLVTSRKDAPALDAQGGSQERGTGQTHQVFSGGPGILPPVAMTPAAADRSGGSQGKVWSTDARPSVGPTDRAGVAGEGSSTLHGDATAKGTLASTEAREAGVTGNVPRSLPPNRGGSGWGGGNSSVPAMGRAIPEGLQPGGALLQRPDTALASNRGEPGAAPSTGADLGAPRASLGQGDSAGAASVQDSNESVSQPRADGMPPEAGAGKGSSGDDATGLTKKSDSAPNTSSGSSPTLLPGTVPTGASGGSAEAGSGVGSAAPSGAASTQGGSSEDAGGAPGPAMVGGDPVRGLAPTTKKQKPAVTLRPAMLSGNRDWVIPIECKGNSIALVTTAQQFTIADSRRADNELRALADAVRQLIDSRQSRVRPGDPPYRPMIHFRVRPDGLRAYYLAYPALEALHVPMARENLEAQDETKAGRP